MRKISFKRIIFCFIIKYLPFVFIFSYITVPKNSNLVFKYLNLKKNNYELKNIYAIK